MEMINREKTPGVAMKRPGRMHHIDGIKGILCFMVLLGHFWNIYRNCTDYSGFNSYTLNLIKGTFIDNPILLGTFWLYAFLVISGYLLSVTRVRSVSELARKTARRFIRFFLPILGACLFIYLLQETVGFYTEETTAFFTNKWFQKFYRTELGWTAIFTESIRAMTSAVCNFNTPFWVIRDMFLSSFVIYVCNFVDYGRDKKNNVLPVVFLVCALYLDRPVIIACLAGYMLGYYREQIERLAERKALFWLVFLAAFGFAKLMKYWKVLPKVFDNIFLYILVWCAIVIFVNRTPCLVKFFSSKIFLLMGKISFGVYSFHWPVICSAGSYVLVQCLENQVRTLAAFGLSLAVSVAVTVMLSVIYLVTVEKTSDRIIHYI